MLGRSRRTRGARCFGGFLGFGSETVPSRSSFGARLRSRVPQYGHSVMYGETSEPQLLHTTKRSGPLAIPGHSTPPGEAPSAPGAPLCRGGLHDLAHDLGVVAVRLVHDTL